MDAFIKQQAAGSQNADQCLVHTSGMLVEAANSIRGSAQNPQLAIMEFCQNQLGISVFYGEVPAQMTPYPASPNASGPEMLILMHSPTEAIVLLPSLGSSSGVASGGQQPVAEAASFPRRIARPATRCPFPNCTNPGVVTLKCGHGICRQHGHDIMF